MPLIPEGSRQATDLSRLGEDGAAAEAFARLWGLAQDRLTGAARRYGLSAEEAEDVVQTVAVRLWERRASAADLGVGAFWAYAFRMTKNLAIDRSRRDRRFETVPADDETIPPADRPYVDALVEFAFEQGALDALADRLWLGEPPADLGSVLAVQLCLTEGLAPFEAAAALGIDPAAMEGLVRSAAVARYATCAALLWPDEALAAYVLDPTNPPSTEEMEAMLRRSADGRGEARGAWKVSEAPVVVLHARYGMTIEEIVRVLAPHTTPADVAATILRIVEAYPFLPIAQSAGALFKDAPEEALRDGGIWRRLVFEYHARAGLPHRQILDRTAPPAAVFGVEIKPTTLNSWIGNGRLWAQLAAFAAKAGLR